MPPAGALAGLCLLVLTFTLLLGFGKAWNLLLGSLLAGIGCCLLAVTGTAGPAPGPASSGSFARLAAVTGLTGQGWPAGIDLACLAPLWLLMRGLPVSWRARWLAALLFTLGSLAGRDASLAQSAGLLLYLCFIAILVSWFGPAPSGTASRPDRGVLLGVLIAIFAAAAVSSELTPVFMLAACTGLVLLRGCRPAGLPVLLGATVTGWLGFAAPGGVDQLAGNLTAVSDRAGGTGQHWLALGWIVLIAVFAGIGLLRCRQASPDRRVPAADRTLAVLAAAPLAVFALPGAGGDTALFALPPAAILAALAFFPRQRAERRRLATAAASVLAVGMCLLVLVARDGNEEHARTPAAELARHAQAGVATPDWTWAGYLLFGLAVAALLGREFTVLLRPGRRQLIAELTLISLPLLAGFGAIVALRFGTLG